MALGPAPTSSVIAGADFTTNLAAVRPPAMPDLKLWCFPRTPGPTINLVDGTVLSDITVTAGAPRYRTAWVDLYGEGIGIETGIADALHGTLMIVAKAPGQSAGNGRSAAPLIDNSTPSGVQFMLGNYANEMDFFVAGPQSSLYHLALPGGYPNSWGFYAVAWQSGVGCTGYAMTANLSQNFASATNHTVGSNTFKIGAQPAGAAAAQTSESSVAFAAILTGLTATACLSTSQIATIRQTLQAALGLDGLLF